jgi:tetratricopeptide (TPR) repeat protein
MASSHKIEGDLEKSLVYFRQILELSMSEGSNKSQYLQFQILALIKISEIHLLRSNFTKSENLAIRAIRESQKTKKFGDFLEKKYLLEAKRTLLNCYLAQNRAKDVVDVFKDMLILRKDINLLSGTANECKDISRSLLYQGRIQEALELLTKTMEFFIHNIKDESQLGIILSSMADIEVVRGQHEKALATYEEALRLFKQTGTREIARSIINFARALIEVQEESAAKNMIDDLKNIPLEQKTKEEQLLSTMIQAEATGLDDFPRSQQLLYGALNDAWKLANPWLFVEINLLLSLLYLNHVEDKQLLGRLLTKNVSLAQKMLEKYELPILNVIVNVFQAFIVCSTEKDFERAISLVTEAQSLSEQKNISELYLKSQSVALFLLNQRDNFQKGADPIEIDKLLKDQSKDFISYSISFISCCN